MARVTLLSQRDSHNCHGLARTGVTSHPLKGGGYVTPDAREMADHLAALAERVERLTPSPRRPDGFFEDRSEIAHELREAARVVARRPTRG